MLDSLLDDPNGNVVQDQDEGFDKVEDSGEDNEDAEEEETVLDDRQKYKLVTPIVMRIGNLIACHPTKKFLQYLDALNELEKRIRPELQKDFFRPVSRFSTKKCPILVSAEFCHNMTHKIEQMLVFFSIFLIWR